MVKNTFDEIKAIEEKARKIIEAAEKSKILGSINTKKKVEALLSETDKSARAEAQLMIEQARNEAEVASQEINKNNLAEIEELSRKTAPKIKEARKFCQ